MFPPLARVVRLVLVLEGSPIADKENNILKTLSLLNGLFSAEWGCNWIPSIAMCGRLIMT